MRIQESIRTVDLAFNVYIRRNRRHDESIPIFKWQVRNFVDALTVRVQVEHDPSDGMNPPESPHSRLGIGLRGRRRLLIRGRHCPCLIRRCNGRDLGVQLIGILVQRLLLCTLRRFARELRGV